MAKMPFTSNHEDLSTNRGFQSKFHCRKCGNGYMSTLELNALGTGVSAAQAVSSLFAGPAHDRRSPST